MPNHDWCPGLEEYNMLTRISSTKDSSQTWLTRSCPVTLLMWSIVTGRAANVMKQINSCYVQPWWIEKMLLDNKQLLLPDNKQLLLPNISYKWWTFRFGFQSLKAEANWLTSQFAHWAAHSLSSCRKLRWGRITSPQTCLHIIHFPQPSPLCRAIRSVHRCACIIHDTSNARPSSLEHPDARLLHWTALAVSHSEIQQNRRGHFTKQSDK